MKKLLKVWAAAAAVALLGTGIISCANNDDDDDSDSSKKVTSSSYTGPSSVETPDLSVASAAAGTITMNGTPYDTLQEAFNAATAAGDYVITLTPGTYEANNAYYKGSGNITIKGLGSAKYGADVILAGKGDNTSSSTEKNRAALEYEGSGTLILENLTVHNTYLRSEDTAGAKKTQCEALGFDGAYCAAYNCGFFAYQDTIRTIGKAWFYGCYIEGDVDFIWMERAGKVALYENCAIKSVYDTSDGKTPASYILAPGMTAADNFNKGLVIYNSAVDASVNTYFFRNPWGYAENLYNIGSFVNVKVLEKENVAPAVQMSSASNNGLDSRIGWKLDADLAAEFTSKSEEIHTISSSEEKAEFSGRNIILNRIYKLNPGKYSNDTDVWDVNTLASSMGWNVTADSSRLDSVSSAVKANGTYKIADYAAAGASQYDSIDNGSSTDGYVSWTGFKYHGTAYGTVTSAGTVSIQVAGPSIVSFVSSTYTTGTFKVTDGDGNRIVDSYSAKPSVDKGTISVAYTGAATTLTFTFTGTTYVGDITVSASEGEKQMIKKIVIEGDDAVTVGDSITLTAAVTTQYCAPVSVKWTSSNEEAATVDENGKVTGVAAGETTITATSTFDSTKSASIKVSVTEVKSAKATWLNNTTGSLAGTASDETLITVSDAVKSTGGKKADGTDATVTSWTYNSTKLSGEGICLVCDDDNPEKGEWYLDYPITATVDVLVKKVSINWGSAGTGNLFARFTFIDENGKETVISDTNTVVRNTDNASSTFAVEKTISKGETGTVRISIHGDLTVKGSTGYQSMSGRSPVWGVTEITVFQN